LIRAGSASDRSARPGVEEFAGKLDTDVVSAGEVWYIAKEFLS